MKRLYVTAALAGAIFFSVESANAQVYENSESETPFVETQQTKYTQIEEQDLPNEVRQAVEKDYQGATLSEIYSAEEAGEVTYKLVVSTQDGENKELFADGKGNWIKHDDQDLE